MRPRSRLEDPRDLVDGVALLPLAIPALIPATYPTIEVGLLQRQRLPEDHS